MNKHIIENIIWSFKDGREQIFSTIYEKNLWQSAESISGKGSELNVTENLIKNLPELFEKYDIKSVIDAPCGDYNWMKNIDYKFEHYWGIDIVKNLIQNNQDNYSSRNIQFQTGDILDFTFPKSDLILCRDCFIHLNFDEIFKAIKNFKKSGSKYLLTTNYSNISENKNLITGQYRKINLNLSPFDFIAPIEILGDDFKENKMLCLWNLEDIKI